MTQLWYKVEDRYVNKQGFCSLSCAVLRYVQCAWDHRGGMEDKVGRQQEDKLSKKVTFQLL